MLKFFVMYITYMVLFFIVFNYQEIVDVQSSYTNFINIIVTILINTIGIEATHHGSNIILPTAILKVLFGCNGLEAILIFSAAVLAYKAQWVNKINFLLKGITILLVINLFRIVILAYVVEFHNSYFNLMHGYVTRDIMIFLAILLFLMFTYENSNDRRVQQ